MLQDRFDRAVIALLIVLGLGIITWGALDPQGLESAARTIYSVPVSLSGAHR